MFIKKSYEHIKLRRQYNMLNKKHIVIFLALLVASMRIAVAADTADTTTADSQVSDTIEADTTNTIQTQATTNANEDNNNKITK